MSGNRWVCVAAAAVLCASVLVVAEDATTPPAEPTHAAVHAKLAKPWNELPDLTGDQQSKIEATHAKALADIKAIRDKEREDIEAILTNDQKKALSEIESKESEARRAARSARTESGTPATQPAN